MKGQCVAAFGFAGPRSSFTGEGSLLATEARLITDHSAGATLALEAMAHGYACWLALDRKMKLTAAASGASDDHGSAPCLRCGAPDFKTMRQKNWMVRITVNSTVMELLLMQAATHCVLGGCLVPDNSQCLATSRRFWSEHDDFATFFDQLIKAEIVCARMS